MRHHFAALQIALALGFVGFPSPSAGQTGPSILVVTAHPDDEAMFAATIWKAARETGAAVDLAVVTDGAGGYRFSTFAEPLYGMKLTDPAVAAAELPELRRRELRSGADIVGIRDVIHLGERDGGKIYAVDSVFSDLWDAGSVRARLADIIRSGEYDLVITMLPVSEQHAHHKAAAILALEAIASLPSAERPVVVGSQIGSDPGGTPFRELEGFPVTRIFADGPAYYLDRQTPLGLDGRLNYHIVVNWLIAEHKSQGTMQNLMNLGRFERFWAYALNDEAALTRLPAQMSAIGLVLLPGPHDQ